MTTLRKVLPLLTLLLVTGLARAATWTTVDFPGAVETVASGINTTGDIVGYYQTTDASLHGFLLRDGSFTTIDVPGAVGTFALAINDSGQITGYYGGPDPRLHGFFFDGEKFLTLDFPGKTSTFAWGINNAGEIVGTYANTKTNRNHGFKWSKGIFTSIDPPPSKYTNLHGINNVGDIVGYYEGRNKGQQGFILNSHGAFRYFGTFGVPNAVNDHKVTVGYIPAFRLDLKTNAYKKINVPGGQDPTCLGINNSGQIVGAYLDVDRHSHGFLRTK